MRLDCRNRNARYTGRLADTSSTQVLPQKQLSNYHGSVHTKLDRNPINLDFLPLVHSCLFTFTILDHLVDYGCFVCELSLLWFYIQQGPASSATSLKTYRPEPVQVFGLFSSVQTEVDHLEESHSDH